MLICHEPNDFVGVLKFEPTSFVCYLFLYFFEMSSLIQKLQNNNMPIKVQAVLWKEGNVYVIKDVYTGVTTQGKTPEEAMKNLKKALELYFEEFPEEKEEYMRILSNGIFYGTVGVASQSVG